MADDRDVIAAEIKVLNDELRTSLRRINATLALVLEAEAACQAREESMRQMQESLTMLWDRNIANARATLADFEDKISDAGLAKLRIASEKTLQEGHAHVQTLKRGLEEFKQLSTETCERLDRTTAHTIRGINDAVNRFRVEDFRQLTHQACQSVEASSTQAVRNILQFSRWFYWKKALLVGMLSVVVAVVTGLYITGEWPWELHQDVVKQRMLGHAVLANWTHLSAADREMIRQQADQGLV